MSPFEERTHVFVLRIWVERREGSGTDATWRGVVEHLPDGKRHYVKRISEIIEFMMPYMASMGINFGSERWVALWLRLLQLLKRAKHHTWTAP